MEYRKLNISDLKMIMKMNQDFRENFVCEENMRIFLSNPQNLLFACVESNRIIGFCYGYEINRLNDIGNMLYIHEVGVLPQYQGQGVGKKMLNSIKEACKLLGICRFFLFTQKSNIAACALYNSVNGTPAHEDDVAYFFNDLNTPPSFT